jgi:hypothetical protein
MTPNNRKKGFNYCKHTQPGLKWPKDLLNHYRGNIMMFTVLGLILAP